MAYQCPNCRKEDEPIEPKICHRCGKLLCSACCSTSWKNPSGAIITEILCQSCREACEKNG